MSPHACAMSSVVSSIQMPDLSHDCSWNEFPGTTRFSPCTDQFPAIPFYRPCIARNQLRAISSIVWRGTALALHYHATSLGAARLVALSGQISDNLSTLDREMFQLLNHDHERSMTAQCMTKRHKFSDADTTLGWTLIDLIVRVSAF
jgi:hypothetical protein